MVSLFRDVVPRLKRGAHLRRSNAMGQLTSSSSSGSQTFSHFTRSSPPFFEVICRESHFKQSVCDEVPTDAPGPST